jgi:predicted TIM-barrel fold metal-dependent hydrolase
MSTAAITKTTAAKRTLIVDTDVHEHPRSMDALLPYLDEQWHPWITNNSKLVHPRDVYLIPQGPIRKDAIREDGGDAGGYVEDIIAHLDEYDITFGVLTSVNVGLAAVPQGSYATAIASAYNDWTINEMLPADPRLLGSITVAAQAPELAAREIDRVGDHPRMAQIILSQASPEVHWGHERFDPIWEACIRHELPVSMHLLFGPHGLYGMPSASGWPSSYVEARSQAPTMFEVQVQSMVMNGVFERFPALKVLFLEGGFAWVPSMLWRLDEAWEIDRRSMPWLKRRPSDYARDHVRLSTQPLPEPDDKHHLEDIIEMMGTDRMLMFATDFPHWDFDAPDRAIPSNIGADLRRKIFWENSKEFYGLTEPVLDADE